MTLCINARFLTQPMSGVQRYAHELLSALDRRLANDPALRRDLGPVVALHPAGRAVKAPGWDWIKTRALPGGSGHLWEQGALWRATKGVVLLSLGNSGPVLHRRHVLALHDANIYEIPQAYSRRYLAWHRRIRPLLARRAAGLITVSQFSATELARHVQVDRSRFAIVSNSAEHVALSGPDPQALARHGLVAGYWLSLGNQSPNKNIAALVAAHRLVADQVPPLVIAGGHAPGLATQAGKDAQYLGRVSDGELRALYQGAAGFLFPSLYEGFGIPPLEAMQLGVPVLAARRTALPEILGDAAAWFDPLSVSGMAAVMQRFAQLSMSERARMIAAGRARAAGFSWDASADQLAVVLRRVMQAATTPRVSVAA